jgi:GNAT superfamily N-acetyltransferase
VALAAQRELDLLGARAWPPLEASQLDEWRLRFAGGVTKRANSVLPLGPTDAHSLEDASLSQRVDTVEHAYTERGLPAMFQITASSWPPMLADLLARRGYEEVDPTLVMTAPLNEHVAASRLWQLTGQSSPPELWLETWWSVDGRGGPAELEIARGILDRIELPCLFVESRDRIGVAGVALGVVDGAWVGLYCLAVLPRARGRACAYNIVAHLLAWARSQGADRAHLAVTQVNEPSQRLCRMLGFADQQRYSYWRLPRPARGLPTRGSGHRISSPGS